MFLIKRPRQIFQVINGRDSLRYKIQFSLNLKDRVWELNPVRPCNILQKITFLNIIFAFLKLFNPEYYNVDLFKWGNFTSISRNLHRKRCFTCLHELDCHENKFESKIVFPCSSEMPDLIASFGSEHFLTLSSGAARSQKIEKAEFGLRYFKKVQTLQIRKKQSNKIKQKGSERFLSLQHLKKVRYWYNGIISKRPSLPDLVFCKSDWQP